MRADSRTDGALQRQLDNRERGKEGRVKTVVKEGKDGEQRRDEGEEEEEKKEESLPRRACFILGLSMVTVAVLLPLTET